MPAEGRDLSSSSASEATKSRWIGDESNTHIDGYEVAGDVANQSEGSTQVPLLCALRQAVSGGCAGTCVGALPGKPGRTGRGRSDVRGHRGVWRGEVAGGTDGGTP